MRKLKVYLVVDGFYDDDDTAITLSVRAFSQYGAALKFEIGQVAEELNDQHFPVEDETIIRFQDWKERLKKWEGEGDIIMGEESRHRPHGLFRAIYVRKVDDV